jgi:phage anti-repressor protein
MNSSEADWTYKGVLVRRREKDGLVSISDLWKAEGKPRMGRPDEWIKSRSVQEQFRAIAEETGAAVKYYPNGSIACVEGVLDIVRGGGSLVQGVFGNSEFAIAYAKALNSECGEWAERKFAQVNSFASLTSEVIFALIQSDKEFPVDFDDAIAWWDVRTKEGKPVRRNNLIRTLKKEFLEGAEFTVLKIEHGRDDDGTFASDKYYLTVDCFKMMGMMVSGERGRQIRMHFINCEKELKRLLSGGVPLEQQIAYWQQRLAVRLNLKDELRVELVDAALVYIRAKRLNPIKTLSDMHDTINERIQGIKAREVRERNKFPKYVLLRDYYEKSPLEEISAINRLGANYISRYNMHPVDAIHKACDDFLRDDHVPLPLPIAENVHAQGRRLKAAKKKKDLADGKQLELWEDNEAS